MFSQHLLFLNENTFVSACVTEDAGSSAALDVNSEEEQIIPFLKFAFPDENGKHSGSWQVRSRLGIPIHHDPELRVHVPVVVNPAHQVLLSITLFENSGGDATSTVPLSSLRSWARANTSLMEWDYWSYFSVPAPILESWGGTCNHGIAIRNPRYVCCHWSCTKTPIPVFVYDLSPHRRVGVAWGPSEAHFRDVTAVWNTGKSVRGHRNCCWATEIIAEPTLDIFMTEYSLVVLETVRLGLYMHSVGTRPGMTALSRRSVFSF